MPDDPDPRLFDPDWQEPGQQQQAGEETPPTQTNTHDVLPRQERQ